MSNPLTAGAIRQILTNPDDLPKDPVLQVLGLKKINSGGGQERYRLVLSDGIHAHTCAMLGTQLNNLVNSEQLDVKAVIKLNKFICNVIQETRKVLIILELTVIDKGADVPRYGDPQAFKEETDGQSATGGSNQNNKPNVQQSSVDVQSSKSYAGNSYKNQQDSSGPKYGSNRAPVQRNQTGPTVFPISALNPYQSRWTICARVTSKSNIRTWSNSRGEGRLFSVDLIDESGEIRATCFTQLVDKFYDLLEPNKVYYISKGTLKPANKKYTTIKNDYEMTFNNDTTIELCTSNDNLPTLQFNFCEIGKLQTVEKDALVDVLGVCTNVGVLSEITVKSSGKQVSKRDVTLLDKTAAVNCTLWGGDAENFSKYENENPILAIKGAKVSDFGGRTLSLLGSSVMQVNPDNLQQAFQLRGWYDKEGHNQNIASISGRGGGEGLGVNVYKTIWDIKRESLGMEKADYFSTIAHVCFFRKENCLYKACPSADCNKKVIEDGDHFRCEKCGRTYPNFKYRLILSTNIADETGEQWVTCFQESAEQLLSRTADEVGAYRETDEKAFEEMFADSTFKTYVFRIRAKMETYNDETRLKCTVAGVAPVDYEKEGLRLANQIIDEEGL